jgi:CDP-6-deoxy-D-xylo-4-hexulose-3-dehydrase
MFIFDELGWNFEPSELGAAFGLQQLKKLRSNYDRRQRNFSLYQEFFRRYPNLFLAPRQTPDLVTAWHTFTFVIRPDAGFARADLQEFLEARGVSTRTVWTGNAARQPLMKNVTFRQPDDGLPNADRVLEAGMLLTMNHRLDDDDVRYICACIEEFLAERGLGNR